jgi:hypothetical protein
MLEPMSIPMLSPILHERKFALAVFASGGILLALMLVGVFGWPCPLLHFFGVPCPGCGLTRATFLLLSGDFQKAMKFHAFAPVVLAGLGALGAAGLLPDKTRRSWVDWLVYLEQRTGIVLILIAASIVYWLARLLLLNADFVRLIRG